MYISESCAYTFGHPVRHWPFREDECYHRSRQGYSKRLGGLQRRATALKHLEGFQRQLKGPLRQLGEPQVVDDGEDRQQSISSL